ncbi:MAG: S-layer homology domain-containing protein, partial [Clostridia bacterium]|nr:S-layer homology domain-containing protein [Clostridia bacterium]
MKNIRKMGVALLLAIFMLLPLILSASALTLPGSQEISFTDVTEKDWFYNSVKRAYTLGLMEGVSDTEFAPNANMSRAMAVTVIYRDSDKQFSGASSGFDDVAEGKWYSKAVAWARENGIVNGRTADLFVSEGNVTRAEFAVMLDRFDEKT